MLKDLLILCQKELQKNIKARKQSPSTKFNSKPPTPTSPIKPQVPPHLSVTPPLKIFFDKTPNSCSMPLSTNQHTNPMKQHQVKALKHLILASKDIHSPLTRKLLLFLIKESRALSQGVCVTLREGDTAGFTKAEIEKIKVEFFSICRHDYSTHISEILRAMDSRFRFSAEYGHFVPETGTVDNSGQFYGLNSEGLPNPERHTKPQPFRVTFSLCRDGLVSKKTKRLLIDKRALEKITLKSGLYARMEPENA